MTFLLLLVALWIIVCIKVQFNQNCLVKSFDSVLLFCIYYKFIFQLLVINIQDIALDLLELSRKSVLNFRMEFCEDIGFKVFHFIFKFTIFIFKVGLVKLCAVLYRRAVHQMCSSSSAKLMSLLRSTQFVDFRRKLTVFLFYFIVYKVRLFSIFTDLQWGKKWLGFVNCLSKLINFAQLEEHIW